MKSRADRIIFFAVFILLMTGDVLLAQGSSSKKKNDGVLLKDIASISGIRTNQLLGYGLVVGLPGSGDSRSMLAAESIQNLLGNLGQKLDRSKLNARNIAAVLVTAELPPFAKRGDRVNVTVSSIGDAKSLEGGVLIQTPLHGGNNQIYGVSQGVISMGGGEKASGNSSDNKTVGIVLNGGAIEKEISSTFVENRIIKVSLNNFDFATLNDTRNKIKELFPATDPRVEGGSLVVTIPAEKEPVEFIAEIEAIRINPQTKARVVINERTGTIVMGGDIHVDPVSVTRGGMDLTITGTGRQKTSETMGIHVSAGKGGRDEEKKPENTKEFKAANVQEIISALNSLGAGVKDVIAILQALKEAGALHADLIVI